MVALCYAKTDRRKSSTGRPSTACATVSIRVLKWSVPCATSGIATSANFYPHLPFKPYEDYEFGAVVVQEWVELARKGQLKGPLEMLAMRFKPVEELYDSENDPLLIDNVIDDPQYAEVV